MKYILSIVLIFFFLDGICQLSVNDTLIYNGGNERFSKMISREIDKSNILDGIKQETYSNVNMRIDRTGRILSVDIFTVGDTSFSKILYSSLMLSDNKWSTSLDDGRIFNILFYFNHSTHNNEKEIPIKYSSSYL